MWVPHALVELFQISRSTVDALREELSSVKAERDALRHQLVIAQNNFEWTRTKVNSLEAERTGLIEKAYGIKLPTPEIARVDTTPSPAWDPRNFSFEDIGNEAAKVIGLPVYE